MIPLDDTHRSRQRSAAAKFLLSELADAFGGCDTTHEAAADAVAAYWSEHFQDCTLDSKFISLLLSRALAAAGDKEAARDWLARRNELPDALMPLVASRDCSDISLATISSEIIRPEEWSFSGGHPAWVLDCGHMVLGDAADMELVCYRALRGLIERVAPAWDGSSGKGALGLRRVASLGGVCDVEAFCAQVLATLATRRGWASVPAVVRLDIAG